MKERVSYGIILVKKQAGSAAEFLLVRNRVSNQMSELVRKPTLSANSPEICGELLGQTTFFEKQLLCRTDPLAADAVAQHLIPVRVGEEDWARERRRQYASNFRKLMRNDSFQKQVLTAGHAAIPWVVPRGRLNESREEPRTAALRELREETGVDLEHVLVDTVFHREFSRVEYGVHYRFHYFLAVTCTDARPSLSLSSAEQVCELSEMAFMSLQRVKTEAPDMFPMLKAARQYLKNTYPFL